MTDPKEVFEAMCKAARRSGYTTEADCRIIIKAALRAAQAVLAHAPVPENQEACF